MHCSFRLSDQFLWTWFLGETTCKLWKSLIKENKMNLHWWPRSAFSTLRSLTIDDEQWGKWIASNPSIQSYWLNSYPILNHWGKLSRKWILWMELCFLQNELYRWRAMIAEYPDLDIFLAGIFSPFLIDQRKSIAPSSMQSIGSAISVMAILSVFFLPDKASWWK